TAQRPAHLQGGALPRSAPTGACLLHRRAVRRRQGSELNAGGDYLDGPTVGNRWGQSAQSWAAARGQACDSRRGIRPASSARLVCLVMVSAAGISRSSTSAASSTVAVLTAAPPTMSVK